MSCGIIGLFGSDCSFATEAKRNFLLDGLFIDALRGKDSTGIAMLPKHKGLDPKIFKRAISGPDFVELSATKRLIGTLTNTLGAIGHNRSITRGWIDDESAHPFQYDHITLVHNGTVQNADWLAGKKNESGSSVDSAQVAWCFSQKEPDELLPKMNGGFSLVWWDARDATLHFARNTERPMYLLLNDRNNMMYFASELGMLKLLTDRSALNTKSAALFTAPYIHYVFKDPEKLEVFEKRPFAEKKTKKIKKQHPSPWKDGETVVAVVSTPGKNSSISTATGTVATTIFNGDNTKEGLRPDGTKHPVESETLSKGMVDTIRSTNNLGWRLSSVKERAEKCGFTPFHTIVVTPRQWKTYQDESKQGSMLCTHSSGAIVQIFDVTMGKWQEYCLAERIPIEVVNYRNTYDDIPETVFTGYVNQRLYEKTKKNKEQRNITTDSEDLIEIGNKNPKLVTPAEFLKLTEHGCYECETALSMDSKILWVGLEDETCPLCESCGSNDVIVRSWENATKQPSAH
jgi:predicted glutamine amidotransferase